MQEMEGRLSCWLDVDVEFFWNCDMSSILLVKRNTVGIVYFQPPVKLQLTVCSRARFEGEPRNESVLSCCLQYRDPRFVTSLNPHLHPIQYTGSRTYYYVGMLLFSLSLFSYHPFPSMWGGFQPTGARKS